MIIIKKFWSNITSNFHYRYALILPFLYALINLFLNWEIQYSIRSRGVIYLVFQENAFNIIALFLLILNFILFAFYRAKITRRNKDFKVFNLNTNAIAKKLTLKFTITVTVCFIIATLGFGVASFSRYEADSKALKQYNLISEDTTLFTYDDVTEINVYLEMESRGKHSSGYATVIELKADNKTFQLYSSGFDDDYTLIKQFLSYFDEDIITVDNTHSDETDDRNFYGYYDHPEIFEEIYQ